MLRIYRVMHITKRPIRKELLMNNEQIKELGSKPLEQKDLEKIIETTEKIADHLIIIIGMLDEGINRLRIDSDD